MRLHVVLAAILVAASGFAGCLRGHEVTSSSQAEPGPTTEEPAVLGSPRAEPVETRDFPACDHPWPCGDGTEWPHALEGPFGLAELWEVRLASHDGTELHGWIYVPDVPEGVRVPTVLWSHPYFSVNYDSGDSDAYWNDGVEWGSGLDVRTLVENGYAFAAFSVRGTAESGGCFSMGGDAEQKDQAFLVERLAAEPWSNGRVAMMGLSYHGTTPWQAAIQSPPSLKTVVVAGMVSDWYTFYHTPQGAVFTVGAGFQALFNGIVGGPPRFTNEGPPEGWDAYAAALPDRACPEFAATMTTLASGTATDVRDAGFWKERRYVDRFPNVTAAVLLTHGFQDAWGSGHEMQESAAWTALPRAPKWQVEGQWGHEFPHAEGAPAHARLPDFGDHVLAWLDFWLKGVGAPPAGLGSVDYQDGAGEWRTSAAWPPAEARDEVLYLAEETLASGPASGARTFRAAPDPVGAALSETDGRPAGALCQAAETPAASASLLYVGAPATADVVVAGNPHAYLSLESDLPGGRVAVSVFDLAPDFACEAGEPRGARAWAVGVADLRFHAGNLQGRDFPVAAPTHVRVDLTDLAEVLPAGHRLAVLVHHGDATVRTGQPFLPAVTVHADGGPEASHVVLPVVEGTLGGTAPTLAYPPRPFVPATG